MKSGFLEEEKPVRAIDGEALEEAFKTAQAEAKRLRSILDPEETPYESRYEERSVLSALSKQAAANEEAEPAGSSAARRARTIRAIADGQLGRNFMDTEEPGAAQPKLESAIAGLEGVAEEAVAHVEALNNLGVVWCNRGELDQALELLERARVAHASAETTVRAAAAVAEGPSKRDAEAAVVRLADASTLTIYYLAQVYGNLGRRAEAAALCHETMKRQLARRTVSEAVDAAAREAAEAVGGAGSELAFGSESRSEFAFDANEWARNACDLAKYYATVARLDVSEHCLHAAESVLGAARKADALRRAEAKRAAAAAKDAEASSKSPQESEGGAIEVSDAADAAVGGGGGGAPTRLFLNGTAEDKAEAEEKAKQEHAAKQQQQQQQGAGGEGMTEDEAEAAALIDLAWARLWLATLKRAAELRVRSVQGADAEFDGGEAEKEGEALGALAGLSFAPLRLPATHALLADLTGKVSAFEGARALFKLGSARAARAKATLVLDGFVTSHFEVLEVESDLYAQLAMWETDPARRHAMHKRRLNLLQPPLGELNEKAYTQLVRQGLFDVSTIACEMLEIKSAMHASEPLPRKLLKLEPAVKVAVDACTEFISRFDAPNGPPERVEEEQERAYVQCHFHLARAHGTLETPASLGASLREYEFLSKYLTRNKVEGCEQEVHMCVEMAELLPHKIANAQRAAARAA
jgi:hypothetical protein